MRRYKNLNESVKIDVVELTNNHDDILVNDLRDTLEDIGATVSQEKEDGTIYMVVDDLTYDDIVNELSPLVYDIDDYIVDTELTEHYDYPDDEDYDYPEEDYEDDDYPEDDYPEYNEDDYPEEDYDDNWDPIEDLNDKDWEDYDDEFECDGNNCFDDEDEEFNNTEDYDEDDELNDDFDVDECYESYKPRYTSKRKGCCPPKKSRKVNLSEALKQNRKNKFSIRDVVRSAKNEALNESTIKRAMKKMKNLKEDKLNEAIHNIGTAKYNLIMEAINAKRPVLYTKKTINGKNISEYSSKELFKLLKEAKKQYLTLKQMLNESNDKALNEKIDNKKRLIELLDDELTYRLTFKNKMNESDEENMLKELPMGPEVSSTDDEEKDENTDDSKADETSDEEEKNDDTASENDEEVELSRVVITLDTQEAADELKQDLVDAGVPEDAITIGDDEEETEETSDEESTDEEESEETSDESNESNESTHYNNFKKLLEADEDEESTDEENTDETSEESDDETSEDEGDEEKSDEDEEITLVLTDTDYIHTLADVLNDKYGITKEEFEEMIGGEIVDSDDEDSNNEDDSEDEESKEDDKEEKSSNGDDAIDAMSPEEIDKLFGDN